MLIQLIKIYLKNYPLENLNPAFTRNLVKAFLQYYILNFLYNSKKYNQLLFTGGTCLRICFNLPRLSEDLDFDTIRDINKDELITDLNNYFTTKLKLPAKSLLITKSGQQEKIYLKFDILKELNLWQEGESSKLYVKVEIEPEKTGIFKKEISYINEENFSFLINRYSLPDLMAGKINAIFTRNYFKGKKNEIDFKGRDWFDLIWYMNKKVRPDLDRLNKILRLEKTKMFFKNEQELFKELEKKINCKVLPDC